MPTDTDPTASRHPQAAFFDVDNTLIDLKSMFAFQAFYWRQRPEPGHTPAETYRRFVDALQSHSQHHDRQVVNRLFFESFAGRNCDDMAALCQQWFAGLLREQGEALWIAPALALARRLRAEGHWLVAVSGSCHEILAPVLAHLGFDHCLATRLERHAGQYTGRIVPPQMIGPGKAQAVRDFIARHGLAAAHCAACGDHASDADMLHAVGHGFVVPGDPVLERMATKHGWPVLAPSAPAVPSRAADAAHGALHA